MAQQRRAPSLYCPKHSKMHAARVKRYREKHYLRLTFDPGVCPCGSRRSEPGRFYGYFPDGEPDICPDHEMTESVLEFVKYVASNPQLTSNIGLPPHLRGVSSRDGLENVGPDAMLPHPRVIKKLIREETRKKRRTKD
jgi:hypothetical protein